VRVLPCAAWNTRTTLALRRNPVNAGDHQVHPAAATSDVLVPAIALDDALAATLIDAIKVDTQGADHWVISGLERTLRRSPHAPALVEFWLDSMVERNISADDVLTQYRALDRDIGLLGEGGAVAIASNQEILAAAQSAQDHWVNLVLAAR